MEELVYASTTALAHALRDKQVSSQEVVEAYLKRIETVNPQLNAVAQLTADEALAQARQADAALASKEIIGPLHGVPMTIKDQFDTAGVISTAGTGGRAAFVPQKDATAVARMRSAGAILLGKTNLPEFAIAFETDNLVYGRTNNPYDLSRTPGGSSGGEAAIIACGGSPLGLATDAAGSIRWPAHCCGIAGIKPTRGRVPMTGVFPPTIGTTGSLWHAGVLARYVEDLALTLPIISGVDWRDPAVIDMPLEDPYAVDMKGLRVAFHTDNGIATPTSEIAQVVRSMAIALSETGMIVEEARPYGIEQSYDLMRNLFAADGGAAVQQLMHMVGTMEPSPLLLRLAGILQPYALSTTEFSGLLAQLDMFKAGMLSFLEQYDVILCPVHASPALPHGTTFEEDKLPGFSYTVAYNLTGWPVVVVRGGASPEGLPIGVQVVARPWREDVALAVAKQIETISGGWKRPSI
jgi:amidase